jgi:hypothetical protein
MPLRPDCALTIETAPSFMRNSANEKTPRSDTTGALTSVAPDRDNEVIYCETTSTRFRVPLIRMPAGVETNALPFR